MTRRAEWIGRCTSGSTGSVGPERDHEPARRASTCRKFPSSWATYADWPLPTAEDVARRSCRATARPRPASSAAPGRRDRHAEVDGPREPERGHRDHDRRRHDAEQPPRLPLPRSEGRSAPEQLQGQPRGLGLDKAAVEPHGAVVGRRHPDRALQRRRLDPRERAEQLLGLVGHAHGRQRRRDRLRRLLPAADQADGDGHRDAGLADLRRDPRLVGHRDWLYYDVTNTPGVEYAFELIMPVDSSSGRPPRRASCSSPTTRRWRQRRRRHDDHAEREGPAGRWRCRSWAATTRWSPPARWSRTQPRRSSSSTPNVDQTTSDLSGSQRHVPAARRHRRRILSSAVTSDSRRERSCRWLNIVTCTATDASGNRTKTSSRSCCAARSRWAARCAATLSLTLGTPAFVSHHPRPGEDLRRVDDGDGVSTAGDALGE